MVAFAGGIDQPRAAPASSAKSDPISVTYSDSSARDRPVGEHHRNAGGLGSEHRIPPRLDHGENAITSTRCAMNERMPDLVFCFC
jgi:hypothetical protein